MMPQMGLGTVLVIVGGCGYPMIALPTAALGVVTGSDRAMVMPSIYACSVGVAVLLGLIVLRLKAVEGWSGPRAFSQIASERL